MLKAVVKAYDRKYNTKNKVKPSVRQVKQINLPVACCLEGDDVVYILTEDEYNSLSSSDDTVISELQASLDTQKELVQSLNKEIEEYKEKDKLLIDTLAINTKLISDIEELNVEIKEYDKSVNELKLINQLLYNRGLISRIRNKAVDIGSGDVKYIETVKE